MKDFTSLPNIEKQWSLFTGYDIMATWILRKKGLLITNLGSVLSVKNIINPTNQDKEFVLVAMTSFGKDISLSMVENITKGRKQKSEQLSYIGFVKRRLSTSWGGRVKSVVFLILPPYKSIMLMVREIRNVLVRLETTIGIYIKVLLPVTLIGKTNTNYFVLTAIG